MLPIDYIAIVTLHSGAVTLEVKAMQTKGASGH